MDDCLLFARATIRGARSILNMLYKFSKVVGQQINFHKSSIYFSSNNSAHIRNDIVNIFQIQHKTTIEKYLCIHNIVFWKDSMNVVELIKRGKQKLAGWKANTLSKAGWLTLINSNLTGMPNHIMSCFKCPERVLNNLNKECRDFFWGKEKKLYPMAWNKICTPKNVEGLRIRRLNHFNQACLAKLRWKVLSQPNNWWVQLVSRKYLRRADF